MGTANRVADVAARLVVLLAASFGLGSLLDLSAPGASAEERGGHMEGMEETHPVRGLAVAEHGLRLVLADPERRRGVTEPLRFRIVDEHGDAVTSFDRTHTKRMHVIVVRRDLSDFQHLHPEMAADGTWTVPLRLAAAGTYRLFADFSYRGEPTTLADDLQVDGAADLHPLPAVASSAASRPGGFEV